MPAGAGAQPAARDTPAATIALETGEQIWEAGCASCHGKDGKGQLDHLIGFEPPKSFPDFSDCSTSTPESDVQWRAVITHGGRARSFSPIRPAFEGILTGEQIDKVIDHVRGLCDEPAWPRGDLNLPRAMMTEKAFPENELLFSSFEKGSIVSAGVEVLAPTASRELLRWDVIPQVQIPVSRRLHVLANIGYQIPVSAGASTRASRLMFSILWDWVDGGPFHGY